MSNKRQRPMRSSVLRSTMLNIWSCRFITSELMSRIISSEWGVYASSPSGMVTYNHSPILSTFQHLFGCMVRGSTLRKPVSCNGALITLFSSQTSFRLQKGRTILNILKYWSYIITKEGKRGNTRYYFDKSPYQNKILLMVGILLIFTFGAGNLLSN